MPVVIVPSAYQGPTAGQERVQVAAGTVLEALEEMGRRFPGLGELLFAESGRLHRFVSVFVNGSALLPGELRQEVAESDEIEILAAIAGG